MDNCRPVSTPIHKNKNIFSKETNHLRKKGGITTKSQKDISILIWKDVFSFFSNQNTQAQSPLQYNTVNNNLFYFQFAAVHYWTLQGNGQCVVISLKIQPYNAQERVSVYSCVVGSSYCVKQTNDILTECLTDLRQVDTLSSFEDDRRLLMKYHG